MRHTSEISGICTLTPVPFTEDGQVDQLQFEHTVACLAGTGIDGLGLFGVVSEFYKLTDEEKADLARRFIPIVKAAGLYSLISVTDHSTEVAVRRAREFEAMGADCLMVLPPHFMNPEAGQIRRHLLAVAAAVEIPVIIQYAPNETGVSISPEELVQIAQEHSNVLYKIECTDPAAYSQKLLSMKSDLGIMNGYWGINLLDMLAIGGQGVMPGYSCCELYVEMLRRYRAGDQAGAVALHGKLAPYFQRWNTSIERVVYIEKEILRRRGGLTTVACRHPAYEMTPADIQEVEAFLAEFGPVLPQY